jgi:hypothetical protein
VDDLIHDQLLELVIGHIVPRQDLRLIDGVFATKQQFNHILALIQEVYQISYGKRLLQWPVYRTLKISRKLKQFYYYADDKEGQYFALLREIFGVSVGPAGQTLYHRPRRL